MVKETIKIDNELFHGSNITMPILFRNREQIEVKIEEGNPVWYKGAMQLRQFTFQIVAYGNVYETLKRLKPLVEKDTVQFTSVFMGSFRAFLSFEGKIDDGMIDTIYIPIKVQEVG